MATIVSHWDSVSHFFPRPSVSCLFFTVVFVFISKLFEDDVCAFSHWAMTRQDEQIYCPSYSFNYATVRMPLCVCENNHFWLRLLFTFAHSWQNGSFDVLQAENTSTGYWSLSSVQLPFFLPMFFTCVTEFPWLQRSLLLDLQTVPSFIHLKNRVILVCRTFILYMKSTFLYSFFLNTNIHHISKFLF